MLKTIRLYGDMGKRFGRVFRLDIATPSEAIRALSANLPGFRAYMLERLDQPFRVLVRDEAIDEKGLTFHLGQATTIKIIPVVAGAKDGFGQILIGAALIGLAVATGGTSLAWTAPYLTSLGVSMTLGGVAQLLANTPQASGAGLDTSREVTPWTFGSPTTTVGQGGCVPLAYGLVMVSGHLMSAGIDAKTWTTNGFGSLAPDDNGTRGGNGDTSPWLWAKA